MRCMSLIAIGLVCLLVSAAAWAQSSGSVLVGKDSQGRNVYLQVIPLKYMDPALAAIMFGGTVVGAESVNGGSGYGYGYGGDYGNYGDRGYTRRGDSYRGQSYGDRGYGGYPQGRGSYGTTRGYSSRYPAR